MVVEQIRNYEVKTQSHADMEKIKEHMEKEDYYTADFRKYFHVWVQEGIGVFYFIKEKYFESRNGLKNYAISLLQYGARVSGLKESELPVQK